MLLILLALSEDKASERKHLPVAANRAFFNLFCQILRLSARSVELAGFAALFVYIFSKNVYGFLISFDLLLPTVCT